MTSAGPGPIHRGMGAFARLRTFLPFGRVPSLGARELAERLRSRRPPQVLDVRTVGEWARGHIEGALNVPITDLVGRVEALPFDRTRPVVAICLTAHRSIPAVRLLAEAGYDEVVQLEGGMRAWRAAGLPEQSG